MSIVYSQAVATLAASSSDSVHEGLFDQRSISQLSEVRNTMRVSKATGLNSRTELLIYESYRKEVPRPIVDCALADRAWACQERILSPRILRYTMEQLFWECQHHFHAEKGVQSFENFGSLFTTAPGIVWRLMRQNTGSFDRLLGWYNEILHGEYRLRKLTRESDRLPAVSGLPRFVQGASDTSMTYLAGLWKDELQYRLFWGVMDRVPRCTTNSSPLWSWTSYSTRVSWSMWVVDNFPKARFTLEDCDIELAGHDPFGQVKRASLKLTGNLLRVQARISPGRRNGRDDVREMEGDWSSEVLNLHGQFLGDANLDRIPDAEPMYALLLATTDPEPEYQSPNVLLMTLVPGTDAIFERIGIADISQDHTDENPLWPDAFGERNITLI